MRDPAGVSSGHTIPATGMLAVRAALVALLADTVGAHCGFVDLAVTVIAIAQDSPNPAGYATSSACGTSAVSSGHTSVTEPAARQACQAAAADLLAAGVRLVDADRVRWLDHPEQWRHDTDRWIPDPDAWSLPDSWVLRQPLWRWLLVTVVLVAVANGW
ncbi:hypothetical protein DVS28_b0606 (plasmid) [Euzebya pacifica]|uniref:Uncharacterized protein n=1 Tax=Euzebya pacifica TaxID=1608957 RepID=A0A346Y799_9ACTN|nr:hypothetical protein DVS28_b0606 [Euzebya pacifica]